MTNTPFEKADESTVRGQLKVQALIEKLSNVVASYEEREADLRVEITLLSHKVAGLEKELASYKENNNSDDEKEGN